MATGSAALADRPLVVEQPGLALDAAAEAGEVTVGADHPVARDDDRQRVAPVGGAHGAGEVAVAEATGLLAIAHRLPIGDRAQRLPGGELERRPLRGEGNVELETITGEVLVEL